MRLVRLSCKMALALLTFTAYPVISPGLAQMPGPAGPEGSASALRVADSEAELDEHFRRLGAAKTPQVAAPIVARIWALWMQSGRSDVDTLMQRAVIAMQLSEYDYALTQLNRIIEIAPGYAEGWNKRATVLCLMKQYDRSLADISKTLKLEPRHFGALSGRGLIHMARENWKGALDAYRAALAVNPFIEAGAELIGELEIRVEGQKI